MDPTKLGRHRHLFWGLVAHFYKDFILLAVFIFVKVVVGFAGPLGINRLLNYIETNGEGAMVRPWVWISWLFIGPMVGTLAMQWYIFTNTRTLVRIESIIVQLVFEHALRIRIKDEVPAATDQASGATTAIATPDSELAPTPTNGDTTGAHGSGHSQPATDSTAVGSSLGGPSASTASTVAKGKGKHKKAPSIALSISSSKGTAAKGKDKDKEKQKDLIGRINNFISTDVGNIVDSRDFLFMVWYCPLQIVICVWFLYSILGVA
jgi:ABC-type multidrug transport system fused ATPase/permease subunit